MDLSLSTPLPDGVSTIDDLIRQARLYFATCAALLALLAMTLGAAFVHLGPLNAPVALLIAATKALLVATVFMHLRGSRRLTWLFAAIGLLWLLILVGLTLADFLTRGWLHG